MFCSTVGGDMSVSDVRLYVVDENKNPISEVNGDGTETPVFTIRNSPYTKGSNTSIYIEPLKNNTFASYAVSQSADGSSLTPIQASGFTTATTTSGDGSSVSQYSMVLGHELLDTFAAGTYYLWGIGNDDEKTLIGNFEIEVADDVIATVNGIECRTYTEINDIVNSVDNSVITVVPGRTIPVGETSSSGIIIRPDIGIPTGGLYIKKDATLDLNGGTVCGGTVYGADLLIKDSHNGAGKVTGKFILTGMTMVGGSSKYGTLTVTSGSFVPEFNVSKYLAPGYTVESKDGWDKVVPVTYTVSFDANGGTGAPPSQTKIHDTALTLSSDKPIREASTGHYRVRMQFVEDDGTTKTSDAVLWPWTISYIFKNWNTAANGSGTSYNPDESYTVNASATLYAQWNSTKTTEAIPLPNPPTRPGYVFMGWATTKTASHGAFSYTPTRDGDATLYTTWKEMDFILPETLTVIESEAFNGCAFSSVKLSENTTTIGRFAFADCPNLKYIYIPAATENIDLYAFIGVDGLTILGKIGSYAETYAQENGFGFLPAA